MDTFAWFTLLAPCNTSSGSLFLFLLCTKITGSAVDLHVNLLYLHDETQWTIKPLLLNHLLFCAQEYAIISTWVKKTQTRYFSQIFIRPSNRYVQFEKTRLQDSSFGRIDEDFAKCYFSKACLLWHMTDCRKVGICDHTQQKSVRRCVSSKDGYGIFPVNECLSLKINNWTQSTEIKVIRLEN